METNTNQYRNQVLPLVAEHLLKCSWQNNEERLKSNSLSQFIISQFFSYFPSWQDIMEPKAKEDYGLPGPRHSNPKTRYRRIGLQMIDQNLIKTVCIHAHRRKPQHIYQHVNSDYSRMVRKDYEWFNSLDAWLIF